MNSILLPAMAAISISLLGSLPLGNLNITAMYLAARKGIRAACYFALGVVVVEMLYLRVTLVFIGWITSHKKIFSLLQWGVVLLFIALAISSFLSSGKTREHAPVIEKMNPLLLGFTLSAVNPMQIPFWAGWALYFINAEILTEGNSYYNIFTLSAGAGTFLALFIFMQLGSRLSDYIKANTRKIHLLMGILFLVLAGYQIWTLRTNA